MINNQNFINECKKDKVSYREYIIINGKTVDIKAEMYQTAYKDTNWIGTFNLNYIKFTTENDIQYRNRDFTYYKEVNGVSQQIGHYIVTEVVDSDTEEEVDVTAFDDGIKFANKYKTDLNYASGTVTLFQVLQECCTKCGVTLKNQTITNGDFIVENNQFEEDATFGDVIVAVAQMSCNFAFMNYENQLELRFTNATNEIISDYVELEDKRDTLPITCVSLGMNDVEGESVTLRDEDLIQQYGENWLIINDNPFAYTPDARQDLIYAIFDKVKGFGYSAFTSKECFMPYFELGDTIQFKNKAGNNISSIILRIETNFDEVTLSAPSVTKAQVDYINPASDSELLRQTKFVVDKANQTIIGTIKRIEGDESRLNQVEANLDGISIEVSRTLDVSKQYTDDKLQDYPKTEEVSTMIDIKAGEIDTKISEIRVSTDNLIYNSVGESGTSGWNESTEGIMSSDENTSRTTISKRAMKITTSQSGDKYIYTARFSVTSGGELAISGWTTFTGSCKNLEVHLLTSTSQDVVDDYNATEMQYNYDDLVLRRYDFDVITLDNAPVGEVNDALVYEFNNGSGWRYFEKVIKLKNGVKSGIIQFISGGANISGNSGVAYLGDLMVVNGNKPTTWGKSTKDLLKASSDAVTEAVSQASEELGLALQNYPTRTQVTTEINTKAGQIEQTLRAEIAVDLQSYVTTNNLNNMIADYSTTIEMQNYVNETTSSFERTISQQVTAQISGISIGVENLIYNSVGMLGTESWRTWGTGTLSTDYNSTRPSVSKRAMVLSTTKSNNFNIYSPRFEVNSGETYTISGWIYLNNYCSSARVDIFSSTEQEVTSPYKSTETQSNDVKTFINYSTKGSWYYFTQTLTMISNVKSAFIRLQVVGNGDANNNAVAFFSDLMLVKGNKAMTWNVSSKDAQAQITSNSSSITQNATAIQLKLDSSSFTSAAVIGLINNRDGTSTAKITATNIDINGIITANNYFKIKTNGSMEATAGKIGGFSIEANGLYYFGTSAYDGVGLWKGGYLSHTTPSGENSSIVLHAGGNASQSGGLGASNFRLYDNGEAYIRRLYCESGASPNGFMGYIKTSLSTSNDSINYITCTSTKIGVATYSQGAHDIYYAQSDENLKYNIKDADLSAIDYINQIRHIEFNWKSNDEYQQLGFSAQQLKTICEDFVSSVKQPDGYEYDELLQVRDFNILPYVTKAIQELNQRLEVLENERN